MKNALLIVLIATGLQMGGALQKTLFAQDSTSVLENYIREAIQSNEGIRQQSISLEKSILAIQEAKRLYMPQSVFKTDYFLAQGGRTVDFPVGDLVNPVYATLNQLTGSNSFPVLQNQSILLNPNNFYDAKVRTSMPLFNAEIQYNYKIKKQQSDLQKIEVELYKRELAKEVKKGYYQYLQTLEAIRIYEHSLELVRENKRITEKLLANGSGNRTAVQRADNEIINIQTEIAKAKYNSNTAKAYFNFLLNRPLDTEIIAIQNGNTFPDDKGKGIEGREELSKIALAQELTKNSLALSKTYQLPKLSAFIDLGSQSFKWKVNDKSLYYFFGVSLEWNIFAGNRNKLRSRQTELDLKNIQSQEAQIQDQLSLQLHIAENNYRSAIEQYQSSLVREETTGRVFQDTQKMYKSGQAIFIELLDAQNQYINAQNQKSIALTEVWLKWVEVERASASYQL